MSVLFTTMATMKDWKALRQCSRDVLIDQAQQARALHYQIYRNIHDASQMLIVVELPDDDALRELRRTLTEQISALLEGSCSDERVWEPAGWDETW